MTKPALLKTFVDGLLKSMQVKKLVADHYGPAAKERMKQFRSGEVGKLLDLFENNKSELSKVVRSIDAAAPDDDILKIEIRTFGSVYWIEAIEHDDIGYFNSSVDAVVHALVEFEPRITELREREKRERDTKRKTWPGQDEVVRAVLSQARNARRLATQFTEAVGDPMESLDEENGGFDEIASGGVVSRRDVQELYEEPVDFWNLEGTVSKSRLKAFEEGAAPSSPKRPGTPNTGWLSTSQNLLKGGSTSLWRCPVRAGEEPIGRNSVRVILGKVSNGRFSGLPLCDSCQSRPPSEGSNQRARLSATPSRGPHEETA